MKKNLKYIFLFFVITISCKKNPFDYRTKYIGDYHFIVNQSFWSPNNQSDTTYTIEGSIDYSTEKNKISIFFSGNKVDEFLIYTDGTLECYGCLGEFESKNKIKYSCYWASPGHHFSRKITGEKKQ